MKRLTVKEFIEELAKEDQDAIVAFESIGVPHAITQLNNEGWIAGTFLMKKEPRIQKEYFCEDEISDNKKKDYIKVLVLGSVITRDEIVESDIWQRK